MGCGGGSGTNTVTQNSAPPQWLQNNLQSLYGQAQNITSNPLSLYGGQVVAGTTPTQNAAYSTINSAQGQAQPLYNQAQQLITNASQPITPSTINGQTIQQYQNPYTQQVVGATEQQMQQNDAIQQGQLSGNAIQSGASPFGSDRAGLAAAALAGQQDLANNQTIAGLESSGYTTALGEANTEQQAGLGAQEASQYLGQQGGFGLTNLGSTSENEALQGANAQLSAGQLQQQQAQSELNVPYEQYVQEQAYPYQQLSTLEGAAGLAGGLAGGTGSTTSPGPSTASQLGGLGLAGIGLNSVIPGGLLGTAGTSVAEGFGADAATGVAGGSGILGSLSSFLPALFAAKGGRIVRDGGTIPHRDMGGNVPLSDIPDLSISFIPNAGTPQISRGDIPKPPNAYNADANNPLSMQNVMQDLGGMKNIGNMMNPQTSKKGGIIHYDDGGATLGGVAPPAPSANPLGTNNIQQKLAQMTPDQLQQMQMRLPPNSPYGQVIQKTLQQKRMMPNVGQGLADGAPAGAAPPSVNPQQPPMKKGGLAHFADDGAVTSNAAPDDTPSPGLAAVDNASTDYLTQLADAHNNASTVNTPPSLQTPDVAKQVDKPSYIDESGDTKTVVHPSTGDRIDLGIPSEKPVPTPNPGLAIMAAGFGMMAGKSPHALENVGSGALEGLKQYQTQVDTAQKQQQQNQTGAYQTAEIAARNKDIAQTGQYQTGELANASARDAATAAYQKGELGIRQQELKKPELVKDMMGTPVGWATPGSDKITPLSGMPDTGTGGLSGASTPDGAQAPTTGIGSGSAGKRLNGKLINSPASDADIDAYLAKYPPAVATHAEKIASGEEQWPTGFATKNPILMQAATVAAQINPGITQAAYPTFLNYANGQKGNIARSLNVATAHLDTLDKLTDALDNGDTKAINSLSNTFKSQFGVTAPTNFDTAKQIVADEVTKAVIGAGGTGQDREQAAKVINAANSPAQLHEAISTYKTLMGGQLAGLQQQYEGATGRNDFQSRVLTSQARAALNPQQPAANTNTAAPANTAPDYSKLWGGQ